jgi:hypothetical protein
VARVGKIRETRSGRDVEGEKPWRWKMEDGRWKLKMQSIEDGEKEEKGEKDSGMRLLR